MLDLKLGKLPATNDLRDLRFARYVSSDAGVPSDVSGLQEAGAFGIVDWGVLGNDRWRDCVLAGAAHETTALAHLTGDLASFTTTAVLRAYAFATGFDIDAGPPGRNPTDVGMSVRDTLRMRASVGLMDASGRSHRIDAYAKLVPGDIAELYAALSIFSVVGIGLRLPDSALVQFARGEPWDVTPGAHAIGGHYVTCLGRDGDHLAVVAWGRVQKMSVEFFRTCCDEAWIPIVVSASGAGLTPVEFDFATLAADLASHRGGAPRGPRRHLPAPEVASGAAQDNRAGPALEAAVMAAAAVAQIAHAVDCTVFTAPEAWPGSTTLVQVFLHTPGQAADAATLAVEFDPDAIRRGFRGLEVPLPPGSLVQIELTVVGGHVEDPVQRLIWQGRPEAVQFVVGVPEDSPEAPLIGTVIVRRDGVPIGKVSYRVKVRRFGAVGQQPRMSSRQRRFERAFASYASPDRREVLKRVQVLRAAGIECFQDVLDLEPGQRWERELYRRIDTADLFLLFWSRSAKQSEWVRREVDYALGRQNGDPEADPDIRPVVIEGPPVELPWPDLAYLHFFDPLVHLVA